MNVIPAIDVLDGRVVRLAQGDFGRVTDYGDDPSAIAVRHARAGAHALHLVSLDGARDGAGALVPLVEAVCAAVNLPVQAGGGVRDTATLDAVLSGGAARAVVGSVAVHAPALIEDWLDTYGPDALTVALDVRIGADGIPRPAVQGWREEGNADLWSLLDRFSAAGLLHVLCTDIARDGTGRGPNVELYMRMRRRYPTLGVQASGGVATTDDLEALEAAGIEHVIVGRALLDGTLDAQVFA